MNRAQALSKLNRSDMRNAAAERGTQRIFAWNRAHWIGMVVLIAVLLLLQWSSSMYLMPDVRYDPAVCLSHWRAQSSHRLHSAVPIFAYGRCSHTVPGLSGGS